MKRIASFLVWFWASLSSAQELRVGSFNLESGDAKLTYLTEQLREIGHSADIWGFQEVFDHWAIDVTDALAASSGVPYDFVLGTTGAGDRLLIAFNADRFQLRYYEELDDLNVKGRVRAPLVVALTDRHTNLDFLFMNNHLYRSRAEHRHWQAEGLNAWAQMQTQPVIAVGDYNFDFDIARESYDEGYDHMTRDGVFSWIRPQRLVPTQCNRGYGKVLDFLFTGGPAVSWESASEIMFPDQDYCYDNSVKSDHRPVLGRLQVDESSTFPRSY
jgi:hypothetical protein